MENIEFLLAEATSETSSDVAEEIARISDKNDISYLVQQFPMMSPIQKIIIMEILLYKEDKKLIHLLERVKNGEDLFFIQQIAKGILDELELKKDKLFYKKLIKRFKNQSNEDKLMDLSYLGNIENDEVLNFLGGISEKNKEVEEQRKVAIFQIQNGWDRLIEEYKNPKSALCVDAVRQAIYVAVPEEKAIKVIIEDMFSADLDVLNNALSTFLYDSKLAKKYFTTSILNRFFEILKGDYSLKVKETVISLLGREAKRNRDVYGELETIFNEKSFRKKGIIQKILYRELQKKMKEILFLSGKKPI